MSSTASPKNPRPRKPRSATPRRYVLPESLTIRGASEFACAMRGACRRGTPVLDGSGVVEADTAGLQVLAAVASTAREAGKDLRWSAVSPPLLAAAAALGLLDCLQLNHMQPTMAMAEGRG